MHDDYELNYAGDLVQLNTTRTVTNAVFVRFQR